MNTSGSNPIQLVHSSVRILMPFLRSKEKGCDSTFFREVFMLQKILVVFGFIFLAIGILGFIPAAAPNGMLLGLFHVNVVHNLIHLLTGIVALFVGYSNYGYDTPRMFFKIFGIIYALVAVLGIWYGDSPILGVVANNMADVILHFVIAAVSLYLGFIYKE